MDKRNLIFIALFSLAILGLNTGFQYWTDLQKADYLQKKAQYEAAMATRNNQLLVNQTAQVSHLQIIDVDDQSSLAIQTPGAITLLGHKMPPQTLKGLPLTSFNQMPASCAIYIDKSQNSEASILQASRTFNMQSGHSQQVSLLIRENNILKTYPAIATSELGILSALPPLNGGFDPAKIDYGLILLNYDNHFIPVAVAQGDGAHLVAAPFARLGAIQTLLNDSIKIETNLQPRLLVLENDYLQLVISTKGGSLVEVNLPFAREGSPSVVEKVETDRLLQTQSPINAKFPLENYFTASTDGSLKENQPKVGGYYPLLRRTLINPDGSPIQVLASGYQALNLVSDYPDVSELNYKIIEMTPSKLILEAKQAHRRIRRTYELSTAAKQPYIFNFEINIEGDRNNLWIGSGIIEADVNTSGAAPAMKYRLSKDGAPDIENFDLPKESMDLTSLRPDWICNGNAFFGMILDPIQNELQGLKLESIDGQTTPSRLSLVDAQWEKHKSSSLPGYRMLLPISPTNHNSIKLRIFAGPLSESVLKELDKTFSDLKTGYDPDYRSCLSFTGWFSFILRPFAQFMMVLMNLFHSMTHSWVGAIILLTCVLRGMLYPLNAWSNRSMRVMQEISPKVKALQERYKSDPKRLQMEMVTLYRENKVNPVSGCLPILIQIPFLFAMLHIFKTNFSLRGASFIPGWIDDLSAPDVLFSWGYPLPLLGSDFHLLPILLGLVMFIQGQVTNPAQGALTEAQRQQKAMSNMMTFAFTFMFYSLPSGLNIYWLVSSIFGIAQQMWGLRQKAKLQA